MKPDYGVYANRIKSVEDMLKYRASELRKNKSASRSHSTLVAKSLEELAVELHKLQIKVLGCATSDCFQGL